MLLVTSFVPPAQEVQLSEAASAVGADLLSATSWEELDAIVETAPVTLAVVDPYVQETPSINEVAQLLHRARATPIIAYTTLTPWTARALVTLSRRGLSEVVLRGFDDAPVRLQRLITRSCALRTVYRFRSRLAPTLSHLPTEVMQALTDLLERPYAYSSALDVMLRAGCAKATFTKTLHNAGLASPKHLFIAARVLHAYLSLRGLNVPVHDVARKLGYHNPHVLSRHTVATLGVHPHELRRVDDEEEILEKLIAWVKAPSGATERWSSSSTHWKRRVR